MWWQLAWVEVMVARCAHVLVSKHERRRKCVLPLPPAFAALSLAPARRFLLLQVSIVQPVSGVGLVSLAVFSHFYLKVRRGRRLPAKQQPQLRRTHAGRRFRHVLFRLAQELHRHGQRTAAFGTILVRYTPFAHWHGLNGRACCCESACHWPASVCLGPYVHSRPSPPSRPLLGPPPQLPHPRPCCGPCRLLFGCRRSGCSCWSGLQWGWRGSAH